MIHDTYGFQRTADDGESLGERLSYTHRELRARILFECSRIDLRQLNHFLALANAAPGHPVDVTHWEHGRMLFSARIWYYPFDDKKL